MPAPADLGWLRVAPEAIPEAVLETKPRAPRRRRPATRRRHRRPPPLQEVIDRAVQGRRERLTALLPSLGIGALLLLSLVPTACAAFEL